MRFSCAFTFKVHAHVLWSRRNLNVLQQQMQRFQQSVQTECNLLDASPSYFISAKHYFQIQRTFNNAKQRQRADDQNSSEHC